MVPLPPEAAAVQVRASPGWAEVRLTEMSVRVSGEGAATVTVPPVLLTAVPAPSLTKTLTE